MADSLQVTLVFKKSRAPHKPIISNYANDDLFKKAHAAADSAEALDKAGKAKNEVSRVFKEALKTANDIDNHILRNGTIRYISSCMDTNDLEIKILFKEAEAKLLD